LNQKVKVRRLINMLCSYYIDKMQLGWICVVASEKGVRKVSLPQKTKSEALRKTFCSSPTVEGFRLQPDRDLCFSVFQQLVGYFNGATKEFDCCLDFVDCSDFDQKVRDCVRRIPYGETRSYSWVARKLGKPGSARAVGSALRRNCLPILIPCHRVILAGGGIGGFSGGLVWKKRLLQLEKACSQNS
jgi:methylated-DNA-[protein]-cysteine S-methyltransferase